MRCALPFLQRRSLAPSQLAKRKAGGEEEDGEWRPPAVSEGLLGGSGTGSPVVAGCCWFCPWAVEVCGAQGCSAGSELRFCAH